MQNYICVKTITTTILNKGMQDKKLILLRMNIGQIESSDHYPPVFTDNFTVLAINKMRWSDSSGEVR